MSTHLASEDLETSFSRFLRSGEEAEQQRLLEEMFAEHIDPVISETIRYKLRVNPADRYASQLHQDSADLVGDVRLFLLRKFRQIKNDPGHPAIANLRGYVGGVTAHVCTDYQRRQRPRHRALKDKVRYLLNHQSDFASWQTAEGVWLAGAAAWLGREDAPPRAAAADESLALRLRQLFPAASPDKEVQGPWLIEVLRAVFARTDAPVEMDNLVRLIADAFGIKDQTARHVSGGREEAVDAFERVADVRPSAADAFDEKSYLRRVWAEILELGQRQRAALLLNLRDAQRRSLLGLLTLRGVASEDDIARALGVGAAEFGELWNDLPLDDAAIAARLGCTRQQVINLRKSARERLARRRRNFEGDDGGDGGRRAR